MLIYLVLVSILILAITFIFFIKYSKTRRKNLRYKQGQLKEKLKFKEREIASTVTYIANKNTVLSETKDELKEILLHLGGTAINFRVKSLINKLDESLNHFEDWKIFRRNFDEIYPKFITNILKKHPKISHTDLKLCVYLKMGVSNKEIAKLQNVTLNGVKSANLRLKKKMSVPVDISLSIFIRSL